MVGIVLERVETVIEKAACQMYTCTAAAGAAGAVAAESAQARSRHSVPSTCENVGVMLRHV